MHEVNASNYIIHQIAYPPLIYQTARS